MIFYNTRMIELCIHTYIYTYIHTYYTYMYHLETQPNRRTQVNICANYAESQDAYIITYILSNIHSYIVTHTMGKHVINMSDATIITVGLSFFYILVHHIYTRSELIVLIEVFIR